jgi:hypothetical protein
VTSPELRVIGWAVAFSTTKSVDGIKTKHFYTGLVSVVTATAVTLMYVNRYTESGFKAYTQREHAFARKSAVRVPDLSGTNESAAPSPLHGANEKHISVGLVAHGYSPEGEVGVGQKGQLTGRVDCAALLGMDAAGSLALAVPLLRREPEAMEVSALLEEYGGEAHVHDTHVSSGEGEVGAAPQTRAACRRHLPADYDTIGPLPFVTFQRKSVRAVRFGRDPRSSFYSLFQSSEKEMIDVQYLRMFARRYLVHTSQDNNPD